MDKQSWTRMVIAGSVAGAGLTLGGIGLASAQDDPDAPGMHQRGDVGGPFGSELAKQLGVSDATLRAAFAVVRDEVKPPTPLAGSRPAPPLGEQIAAHQAKLASALAKELGMSEAKVRAALEKVRADAMADRRADLAARLSAAVKSGKLTATDKASVLKAFDAGVIGGRLGGGFGRR